MKEVALYIHIPFCKQKCFYCDFSSYSNKENFMENYIKALIKELDINKDKYKFTSMFIGGGTPSYLPYELLEVLLKKINELNFKENSEKTIECNPGTLTEEKLSLFKKYNINRLSLGLQSTSDSLLKTIGRIHNFKEFKDNFLLARKVGFNNINVDLMFGLPNQTLKDWEETLEEIISLNPEHISAYSLIIEEGTVFYKKLEKDLLKLPSEEDEREMYHRVKKFLEKKGYKQYEISNYAKEGRECVHNIAYWKCREYLGVGVAASSYIDSKRIKNIESIEDYINKMETGKDVIESIVNNSEKDNIEEFMFMGLRMMEGINEKEFEKRFNKNIDELYSKVISNNIEKELLERKGGRIYLTPRGVELSNIVMEDMLLE